MTLSLAPIAIPGAHVAQFYESERYLYRSVAAFFAEGLRQRAPAIMIARQSTFEGVAERLASSTGVSATEIANQFRFVDVDAALRGFMEGIAPDPVRFEQSFLNLAAEVRRDGRQGPIWLYGEMVDVLCKAGNFPAAIGLEELWNRQCASNAFSLLCGYAIDDFDEDVRGNQFRAVCGQHTHVIPAEGFTDAPDDRTRFEWVASLQQRARGLSAALARQPPAVAAIKISTVYVVDDDESVRRSLARLLASIDLRVETFASAEAFVADVDPSASGCLMLDLQLLGMSGLDLQTRMTAAGRHMPIIAMSGSLDPQTEADLLRLGASAVLRKPFDAQSLIDALARVSRAAAAS